jgi:hypothetical protein
MGNIAGDVLQVMSPRAADDDGVIQWESTGKKLSIRIPVPSGGLRARLAILYYKADWRATHLSLQMAGQQLGAKNKNDSELIRSLPSRF